MWAQVLSDSIMADPGGHRAAGEGHLCHSQLCVFLCGWTYGVLRVIGSLGNSYYLRAIIKIHLIMEVFPNFSSWIKNITLAVVNRSSISLSGHFYLIENLCRCGSYKLNSLQHRSNWHLHSKNKIIFSVSWSCTCDIPSPVHVSSLHPPCFDQGLACFYTAVNLWAPWLLLTACGTSEGNGSLNETSQGQPPRLPELFPIR